MSDAPVSAPATVASLTAVTPSPAPVQEAVKETPVEAKVENTEEAAKSQEEKLVQKLGKKKLQLKVDGNIEDYELDLDNEEELKKHLQMSKAAQKRMAQAADERKQMEQLLQIMQKSPEKIMKELGIDAEDWAVALLNKKLEDSAKSPEQREKEKLQAELEELKAKYQKDEDDRKKSEFTRLEIEAEKKLDEGITKALSTGGLPKSPLVVKKMAEMMYIALENGIDLEPHEVLPLVRKEIESDIKQFFGAAPDELIEAFLGKDRLSNMRKKQIDTLKKVAKQTSPNSIKATGNEVKANKEDKESKSNKKTITFSDFLRG